MGHFEWKVSYPYVCLRWLGWGFVTEGAAGGPVSSEEPSRFLSAQQPWGRGTFPCGEVAGTPGPCGAKEGGLLASSSGKEKTWPRRVSATG